MGTRFTDGCSKTATDLHTYTSHGGGTQQYVTGQGRFGGTALMISGSQVNVGFADNPTIMFAAFAASFEQIIQRFIFGFYDGTTRQCGIRLETNGTLTLVRGSTVLDTTAVTFLANVQNHFEIKGFVHGSTGTLEVRLNGSATPILTFTGNTQSTGNAFMTQVTFENSGSGKVYFSDIHVWGSGSIAPNTFLGNKRIYTQMPVSDGATNDFSTSPAQSAGSHHLNVDEAPPNDDTDYNFDNTTGHRESYGFPPLPTGVQGIATINAWVRARVDDAGPHTYQIGHRSGGVDSFGSDINPGASYGYSSKSFPVDPNTTVAWLAAGVDAATQEVKITS